VRSTNQISSSLNTDGITYKRNWWGLSVDVTHDRFVSIFQATNYATAFTGALGFVLTGPAALAIGIIGTFIKVYGTALRTLEKGNGMRFHIPWFAIYPMPSPIYIIPIPL